jgi:hypothetical protein
MAPKQKIKRPKPKRSGALRGPNERQVCRGPRKTKAALGGQEAR